MRIITGQQSRAPGYLTVTKGDHVEVKYVGSKETGDDGWLFGVSCPNTQQGWFDASCFSGCATRGAPSAGPGYLAVIQGDEIQVTYTGSEKKGDHGWLYGVSVSSGERGWFDDSCFFAPGWSRLDLSWSELRKRAPPARRLGEVPAPPADPPPSLDPPPPDRPRWLLPPSSTWTRAGATLVITSYGVRFPLCAGRINERSHRVINVRCFHDEERGRRINVRHDGHHPLIMNRLAWHRAFPGKLREVRDFLRQNEERSSYGNELRLGVCCRSGRHRSVAFVVVLGRLLNKVGYPMHIRVQHETLTPCGCLACSWYLGGAGLPDKVAEADARAIAIWDAH